jgi:hypothetical protein
LQKYIKERVEVKFHGVDPFTFLGQFIRYQENISPGIPSLDADNRTDGQDISSHLWYPKGGTTEEVRIFIGGSLTHSRS